MQTTIAVDARQIYRSARRGIGKSLAELYGQLARLRPDWRFLMVHQIEQGPEPLLDLPNVERRQVDIRGGDRLNLWEQLRLPIAAWRAGAAVLHAPANTGPSHPLVPLVLTIHDLIPLETEPDTPATRLWLRRVAAAARKARRIITPSEYSKGQIVRHLGTPAGKVIVNPWAADRRCTKITDPGKLQRVRQRYGLETGQNYVFGFGAADPRKNTRRILDAWADLARQLRNQSRLLLVGFQPQALAYYRELIAARGLQNQVRLHGFIADEDLPPLLSGATLLCYPSLGEGFGLPVLDAFACETPVLTSRVGSLPEVAGDAAVLVEPTDTRSLVEGLEQLLGDSALRATLAARGRERLQLYRWDKCGERLLAVLEEAR